MIPVSCAPPNLMRPSEIYVPMEVELLWDLMTRQWIWTSVKSQMSVNTGSASIRMVPIDASVPLATFWKGMNVWILMNVLLVTLVEMELARM